jgi:hypothetical protein
MEASNGGGERVHLMGGCPESAEVERGICRVDVASPRPSPGVDDMRSCWQNAGSGCEMRAPRGPPGCQVRLNRSRVLQEVVDRHLSAGASSSRWPREENCGEMRWSSCVSEVVGVPPASQDVGTDVRAYARSALRCCVRSSRMPVRLHHCQECRGRWSTVTVPRFL